MNWAMLVAARELRDPRSHATVTSALEPSKMCIDPSAFLEQLRDSFCFATGISLNHYVEDDVAASLEGQ